MEKGKLNIAMEVLRELSVTYPETKESIDEKLENKCSKEHISVEEVIYSSLTTLEANIFYCATRAKKLAVMSNFKAGTCFITRITFN